MNMPLRRLRLRAVWLLVPLYLVTARPSAGLILAGATLALVGALIRAWAAGTIHKNVVLTTTGPYAHTRNPLYLGTFFMGLGLAMAGGRPAFVAVYLAVFFAVYAPTMRREAARLERQFGPEFHDYARRVPLFVPRLRPYQGGPQRGFDLQRYLWHREYQAPAGALLGFLLLILKLVWS